MTPSQTPEKKPSRTPRAAQLPDLHTVVVGGGVAGLAAALEAGEYGDTILLEASDRPGGQLRSERFPAPSGGSWLCEAAASAFSLPAPGISTLLATTGATSDLIPADPASRRRWIHEENGLQEVPASPLDFLRTNIVSPWAKLGLFVEPFVGNPPKDEKEETVLQFFTRRFGAEVAKKVAQPMVTGIFAGNASAISADAAFPALRELETAQGSVLLGGIRRSRKSRKAQAPRPQMHSFAEGMESLPRHFADALGKKALFSSPVTEIHQEKDNWIVETEGETRRCRCLILASGARETARLLGQGSRPINTDLARIVQEIRSAPVVMLQMGVAAETLDHWNGFGFLTHPKGGLRILGAMFESQMFPGRAPSGHHLIRVVMGGALKPETIDQNDDTLLTTAAEDVSQALQTPLTPIFSHIVRHRPGIPQYTLGHKTHMEAIAANQPAKLGLTGWSYRGIGVNSVIADACAVARATCS